MQSPPRTIETEIRSIYGLGMILVTLGIGILFTWIATGGQTPQWATIALAFGSAITLSGSFFCLIISWRLRNRMDYRKRHPSPDKKVFSLETLSIRGKPWPVGSTIVIVTGYFDLLHPGHVEFLRSCKHEPDEVLVVGVHSDDLAKKIKGKDRPFLSAEDRIRMISYLDQVDYIFEASSFYDDEPYHILESIDPDYVIFSNERKVYERKSKLEKFVEYRNRPSGGKFRIRPIQFARPDLSTTSIAQKVYEQIKAVSDKDRSEVLAEDISRGSTVPILSETDWRSKVISELQHLTRYGLEEYPTAAVITFEGRIIGRGYNTRPQYRKDDETEVIHLNQDTEESRNGKPRPVHAEINAVLSMINSSQMTPDFSKCEIYSTTAPCSACAETLAALGINKTYYLEDFYNNYGLLVLKNYGVPFKKLDEVASLDNSSATKNS